MIHLSIIKLNSILDCSAAISKVSSSMEFKDWVSLIAPTLVILTFTIDRILSNKYRKSEFLRTWSYKTLLEPNLDKIEEFYTTSLAIFSKGYNKLKISSGKDTSSIQSKYISEFQELKRNFEFEVLNLIQFTIPALNEVLLDLILDLEDNFVQKIDSYKSPNNLEIQFRAYLMFNKTRLYGFFYDALRFPNKSYNNVRLHKWKTFIESIGVKWKSLIAYVNPWSKKS